MKKSCIVGYGVIAPSHAAAIVNSNYSELCAICDNDPQKLKKAEKDYANVKVFSDFDAMIADNEIDVVHICTPHYLHSMMAEKALIAGKDVVLEKPVCLNIDDFTKLERAREKSGKKVCVCFQRRANACTKKILEVLPELGKIKGINANLMWFKDKRYYSSGDWRGKWATEGGGLIINQAIHLIDLLGMIAGGFKSVNATLSSKCLGDFIEVEDTADMVFETNCGARALFYASNCYPVNASNFLQVHCEDGMLIYTNNELILYKDDQRTVIAKDTEVKLGKDYWGSGHYFLINEFYRLLETGKGSCVSLADVKNTMMTVFAIYNSSKISKRIEII